MDEDDNQIEVPDSFVALYAAPGGHRMLRPAQHVRERYELCEDMAQMLAQRATAAQFATDGSEAEVLSRIAQTLEASESPFSKPEVAWVVRRLAELLDWPAPRHEQG